MERKCFTLAEVKAVDSADPNGAFEVVLSEATRDRDGEIIDAKAFEPLPESIPVHAFHDFSDPIGRARPYYDGGTLKATGVFASTPRAQEIRTLVAEGVIGHTSVGFTAASRETRDAQVHVIKAELLEGSFVSVPSNREAAVLSVKSAALSAPPEIDWQQLYDLAVAHGATPHTPPAEPGTPETLAPVEPAETAGTPPVSDEVDGTAWAVARAQVTALTFEDEDE